MKNRVCILFLIFLICFGGFAYVQATPTSKRITRYVSNLISTLLKWLWAFSVAKKAVTTGRSMVKFESGYSVETVFDGSKLGIEPFSVEVSPNGDLVVLDSVNCNIYRISQSLSRYGRPKLIAGSPDGYCGHIDGRLQDARLNHPTGFTMDDNGNIFVAEAMNMAIRKITDTGVTTIAAGKGIGHADGPSEDAKFSDDFDIIYVSSSCSLLVIDRGNLAIREIPLHFNDCSYQYAGGFPLGIAVLAAATFFGYMLALLQHRVGSMISNENVVDAAYRHPLKQSVRPPLIPVDNEHEKQENSSVLSVERFISLITKMFGQLFFRKKNIAPNSQQWQQQQHINVWPAQESYVIPDDDEPPSLETRAPTPQKIYPFMIKGSEKSRNFHNAPHYYRGWDGELQQRLQYQYQHLQYSSAPNTYYEKSNETKEDIVFGAVQEHDGKREAVVIKPVDYGDSMYNNHNIRSRMSYLGSGYDY